MQKQGVKQGDAVAIYLPMVRYEAFRPMAACADAQAVRVSPREQVCELPIAMLACARIGAVHTVVFAGFSAESLAQRMADSKCAPAAILTNIGWCYGLILQAFVAVWGASGTMGLDAQLRAGPSCCSQPHVEQGARRRFP